MIIKINDINKQQLVNNNQFYPVVAYRMNDNHAKEYRIFDEGNSFTWIDKDIDVLCDDELNYYKCMGNNEMLFLYKEIDSDFFTNFYLEEDNFENIFKQLEGALKSIIMHDFNVDEIMQAIKQTDTNSDYFTLYLDCFFELANNEEINENMRYFTDYCEQLHENDIRKIVDYVQSIDSDEVKLFFENAEGTSAEIYGYQVIDKKCEICWKQL